MDAGEPKPPEKILWMKLPGWANEVPEDDVFYMLEELAVRYKIPLTPYDPNDKEKGKGRKIVLKKKSDIANKHCRCCGKKNEHFTFACPDHPDRETLEEVVIDGVKVERRVLYCDFCDITNDHSTWKCPDHPPPPPFGSLDCGDMICKICGAEDEHWSDVCPKRVLPEEGEPVITECWICCRGKESDHWTYDCPVLANGDRKVCWICELLDDHRTVDCSKYVPPVMCCTCCEIMGDHWTEDCPRETNDGRKYCQICDWMCNHSTENCVLAEPKAAASGSFPQSDGKI